MDYVRIFTGPDGRSHLRDEAWTLVEGDFTPPSPAGYFVSGTLEAAGILMMHHPAGYEDDWHTAPAPVLGTVLRGRVAISATDGDRRLLGPGDQFVAADLTGTGHRIDAVDGGAYDLALVILDSVPAMPREDRA